MSLIKIVVYKTDTKKIPFKDWYLGLDTKVRVIIDTRLDRLSLGNFGDYKLLKNANGVYELRIDYGPGYRIYFGKDGHTIVVLLVGGNKSSQERDIAKAQRYWLIYKESQT